ncbi:ROK family transcriptional regulator [uncultured Subdoligranulum sp.]|mgnify:CR=1 FL=1|uniref:ROK family transcriptional regulator n=1 Tax=uncultured Subdoligranulum sp. TaxID=512298 RepID=UPI00320B8D40
MSAHRPLSTVELRKQNRNRVYRYLIGQWKPVTKQELAFQLSMSLPTLTQNLNELTEMGLIDRSITTDSTGGRRPRLIVPLPNARFALGIELTNRDLRIVAINLRKETLASRRVALPFANDETYGEELAGLIEQFLDNNQLDRDRLLGVAMTLPGIVGPDQKTIEYAPTIGVDTSTPCRFLDRIPYRVLLDNDATCGGFGEWWNRTDQPSMVYLSLNRGVGGAILVDGKLYDGVDHRAAEFGHICLHPGGRPCQCGRKGCLEAYCSTARLSDDLDISLEVFFQRLEDGDIQCQALWDSYLKDLAHGIMIIHTILDCPIMIGGQMSQYLPAYRSRLQWLVRDLCSPGDRVDFLAFCPSSGHSVCIGAATRLLYEFVKQL